MQRVPLHNGNSGNNANHEVGRSRLLQLIAEVGLYKLNPVYP
jgi:hypothetical protein